jgi:hypothetical protein
MNKTFSIAPQNKWTLPLFIALITITLNLPIIDNEFVHWDDGFSWFENQRLIQPWNSWDDIKWIFSFEQSVRLAPISWIIYKIIVSIGGMEPLGVRIAALIFHTANAILIFLICKNILRNTSKPELWAFLTCLLWLVNPLRVEPVAWATGLTYPISTMWALLSFYLILSNTTKTIVTDLIAFLCAILASLSYPIALSVPISLPILIYIRNIGSGENPKMFEKRSIIIGILGLAFSALLIGLTTYHVLFSDNNWGTSTGRDTNVKTALYNISNSLLYFLYVSFLPPREITPGHYPGEETFFGEIYIIALMVIVLITISILYKRENWKLLLALSLLYLTSILPALKIFGESNLQADRFSYLTAWIPVLILIFCLEGSKLNKKIFVILIGGLIGTQTLLSYKQHQIWENTKILVESIRNTKYVQTNQWVNAFLYWSEGKDAEMRKNYKEAFTKYSLISKIEVKGAKVKGEELSDILFKTIFLNSLGGEKESTDFLLSLDQKTLEYYEERFKNKNKSSSIEE